MSIPSLPTFAAVQTELVALALGVDADELHGSLCGYLAAGGERTGSGWPQRLALDPVPAGQLAPQTPLGQLHAASIAQLEDSQFSFRLLLPESMDIEAQARGLIAWCRGFLGGFGLAGGRAGSEDAREALADLGRIAATVPSFEDPEQDAESLEELVEFVRIAVLLLHNECAAADAEDPRAAPDASTSTTLH